MKCVFWLITFYTRDFDFYDPFLVSKCVRKRLTPFSIVNIFLNNEYSIFSNSTIGWFLFYFLVGLWYFGLINIILNICVDRTLIDFQFIFFEGCCFLLWFQKPSPVRPETSDILKYYIPVHFQEKTQPYEITPKMHCTTHLDVIHVKKWNVCFDWLHLKQGILISMIHCWFQSVFVNV